MHKLQSAARFGRRITPRGWSALIRFAARLFRPLRRYSCRLDDGATLIVDLRESMCLPYFFVGGLPHEIEVKDLIKLRLGQGKVFVDVGANVGYYTVLASDIVGESGQVHAFEPAPAAFDLLRRNSAQRPNVHVYRTALGARSGTSMFYIKDFGDVSSFDPAGATHALEVLVLRMDEVLQRLTRLDVVKIDVEGFELDVLRGAKSLIARHRPTICFEFIDHIAFEQGITLAAFEALLGPLGYQVRKLGPGNNFVACTRSFGGEAGGCNAKGPRA